MDDNKHISFWITFGSCITLIELFIFMLICGCIDTFIFDKQYCLLLFPNLIYLGFQFIINYINIINEDKDKHK